VSAPDTTRTRPPAVPPTARSAPRAGSHVYLRACRCDLIEVAALRGRAAELERRAAASGAPLAPLGRAHAAAAHLVLSVRPDRWLILAAPRPPGETAEHWERLCAGCGVTVELTCAWCAFELGGPSAREVLARGCRLDLDPLAFAAGHAAATIVAQVAVTLTALPASLLILTPSTTARHFREWLTTVAEPFGLALPAQVAATELIGERA